MEEFFIINEKCKNKNLELQRKIAMFVILCKILLLPDQTVKSN